MPAWLVSGTRQRTKRLWKGASEGDTRIDDSSDGSPLTIEIGSDSPIGITVAVFSGSSRGGGHSSRTIDANVRYEGGPLASNGVRVVPELGSAARARRRGPPWARGGGALNSR